MFSERSESDKRVHVEIFLVSIGDVAVSLLTKSCIKAAISDLDMTSATSHSRSLNSFSIFIVPNIPKSLDWNTYKSEAYGVQFSIWP